VDKTRQPENNKRLRENHVADRVALDQVLPNDVALSSGWTVTAYRKYPVFSKQWLIKRTLTFALILLPFAALSVLGTSIASNAITGLKIGVHFFLAFMLMVTAGPALATFVRYRRWKVSVERTAVVCAVLAGMLISYFADEYASKYIEKMDRTELNYSAGPNADPEIAAAIERSKQQRRVAEINVQKNPGRYFALNIIILVLIYGSLGGGLSLRAYFSEQRRLNQSVLNAMRLKVSESDMRLGLLQAQIEPHFLFNTLSSIRSLIQQDGKRAEQMLDALVEHLRATIPKLRAEQGNWQSTLGQQLEVCDSYLQLMKLRMGERFEYSIQAINELRNLPFPPLMLISLVENAVKHGLELKPGMGRLQINAECDGKVLKVSVIDNGAGLKSVFTSGVGLSNIREQLKLRYADRGKLDIASNADGGVTTTIELPIVGEA
jgi:hypothetical protein